MKNQLILKKLESVYNEMIEQFPDAVDIITIYSIKLRHQFNNDRPRLVAAKEHKIITLRKATGEENDISV
jgi:hypothetical protein